jgi:hypothetical protein
MTDNDDPRRAAWIADCGTFNLGPNDYGRRLVLPGHPSGVTLIGFDHGRRTYPIEVKTLDGKRLLTALWQVMFALKRWDWLRARWMSQCNKMGLTELDFMSTIKTCKGDDVKPYFINEYSSKYPVHVIDGNNHVIYMTAESVKKQRPVPHANAGGTASAEEDKDEDTEDTDEGKETQRLSAVKRKQLLEEIGERLDDDDILELHASLPCKRRAPA